MLCRVGKAERAHRSVTKSAWARFALPTLRLLLSDQLAEHGQPVRQAHIAIDAQLATLVQVARIGRAAGQGREVFVGDTEHGGSLVALALLDLGRLAAEI